MVDTYIVYNENEADIDAVNIIAVKRGFIPLPIPFNADPAVPNPQTDDNNIVCVGGNFANPYSAYYFTNLHLNSEGKLAGEFGVSPDGLRIIYTKKRANGTTVTIVAGRDIADTLRAATDFATNTVNPLIPIGASAAVIVGTAVLTSR